MKDFQFFVLDDRYSVPTLRIVSARGVARARELARQMLAENAHHLGIEVYEGDTRIFALPSPTRIERRPS